jgi:hypothetical protein
VTFRVHEWFHGGPGDTVTVDLPPPSGTGPRYDESTRSYEAGTRLLVSDMSILGGVAPQYPIAARCGLTRYYSQQSAAEWKTATSDLGCQSCWLWCPGLEESLLLSR